MMKFYTGKEPCAGCGKTGEEEQRVYKNSLCRDCENALKKGKEVIELIKSNTEEYACLGIGGYSITVMTKGGNPGRNATITFPHGREGDVIQAFEKIIQTLHDPTGKISEGMFFEVGEWSSKKNYKVKLNTVLAIQDFLNSIALYCSSVRDRAHEDGSNLLLSLHKGSITMEDFNRMSQ